MVNKSSDTIQLDSQTAYILRLSVQLFSSRLWTPPYSSYQKELFDIITNKHDNDKWNFKQISNWLNDNQYHTPRKKTFTQGHVWSIYKKKTKSIKRVNRDFKPVILDVGLETADSYLPVGALV